MLFQWGCTWLWDNLNLDGSPEWIARSILRHFCISVCDGSYMRERFPSDSSAAFVFECEQGGGRLLGSFAEEALEACSY